MLPGRCGCGNNHPRTTRIERGGVHSDRRRWEEGEATLRRALQMFEDMDAATAGTTRDSLDGFYAIALHDLALLYHRTACYAEAEPLYEHGIQTLVAAFGASHWHVFTLQANLAGFHQSIGGLPPRKRGTECHSRDRGDLRDRASLLGEPTHWIVHHATEARQVLGSRFAAPRRGFDPDRSLRPSKQSRSPSHRLSGSDCSRCRVVHRRQLPLPASRCDCSPRIKPNARLPYPQPESGTFGRSSAALGSGDSAVR